MAKMKSLFTEDISQIPQDIPKELLNEIRAEYKGDEYCDEQYKKYSHLFPLKYSKLKEASKEYLTDILHASVVFFYKERLKLMNNKTYTDYRDLTRTLEVKSESVFDIDSKYLKRNNNGLGFLNSFIKEALLKVTFAGKSKKTLKELTDNYKHNFKIACKTLAFKTDLSLNHMFSTSKLVDTQTVSNFRPTSAIYIFLEYALKQSDEKDIYILVPSEGWLGRLLASFYLAWNYRDRNIHYHTIDPNPEVNRVFHEVVSVLNKYGNFFKVDNWFPLIHQHGSETEEARFRDTYNVQYDLIGTSPPYILGGKSTELYTRGWKISLNTGETITISENDTFELDTGKTVKGSELLFGAFFKHNNSIVQVISKEDTGQANKYKNTVQGADVFVRPTINNAYYNLKAGGYFWWNVADTRQAPTLEIDSVWSAFNAGFVLEDILFYELSRVPGGALQKDGSRKSIRDIKPNHEPVFIFRKHSGIENSVPRDWDTSKEPLTTGDWEALSKDRGIPNLLTYISEKFGYDF
ncbi:hypothetical protein ThvES_00017740 [Thiovulum sp. ES]|nr:hypothetical protein ThvES_00017740 [Thiovulum sp. ES]